MRTRREEEEFLVKQAHLPLPSHVGHGLITDTHNVARAYYRLKGELVL